MAQVRQLLRCDGFVDMESSAALLPNDLLYALRKRDSSSFATVMSTNAITAHWMILPTRSNHPWRFSSLARRLFRQPSLTP